MNYKIVDNKVVEIIEKPVDLPFLKMEIERLKQERLRIDLQISGLQYQIDEVTKLSPKEELNAKD